MFRKVRGWRLFCAAVLVTSISAVTPALASASQRFGARALKVGMQGTDVQTLQRDLTALGWLTNATGRFNYWTAVHVKSFQKRSHLTADGVVGPRTFSSLHLAMGKIEENTAAEAKQAPSGTATTSSATLPAEDSGGAGFVPTNNTPDAPVVNAALSSAGTATAPSGAPTVIQQAVAAANQIAFDPYVYGGGHSGWGAQSGYDCSGSVSYVLHAAGLLNGMPLDSSQLESYGQRGPGKWITIYADAGHTWMTIAGLTFDTVNQSSTNGDDRWSAVPSSWETSQVKDGDYVVVHPAGW